MTPNVTQSEGGGLKSVRYYLNGPLLQNSSQKVMLSDPRVLETVRFNFTADPEALALRNNTTNKNTSG